MGKAFLSSTAKPLLEILENGDNTVDLEAENYKRYIHIKVVNIIKSFDNGELTVELNDYPVSKCTKENFQSNDFEKKYWKITKSGGRHQYCIDSNKEIYL